MTEEDSPIIDFYPKSVSHALLVLPSLQVTDELCSREFHIDMNGKKMLWQGIALLPFIDEKRLLGAMAPKFEQLSEDEHRRNSHGKNSIFCQENNPLYNQIAKLYTGRPTSEVSLSFLF